MSFSHVPVMKNEVLQAFKEQKIPLGILMEGTFGRGGHTKLLLSHFPEVRVISFDRDQAAILAAKENFKLELDSQRLRIIEDDFRNFKTYRLGPVDGVLLDLGVSSPQLDEAERGFSFMKDGPLDMRMTQSQRLTAAKIINTWDDKELADMFRTYGEVRRPGRVISRIIAQRKKEPFETTRQLAEIIEKCEGWRPYKNQKHPATNYFLALRIAVNDELGGLHEFITEVCNDLNSGGRIVVIGFHSLEDRIVKNAFKSLDNKLGHIITKKVMTPTDEEIAQNPRSRSSKMRIFEKG